MAASSTALVMRILQERGEIASPHGSSAFGVPLMQDLAIVPMLTLIPLLAGSQDRNGLPEHIFVLFLDHVRFSSIEWQQTRNEHKKSSWLKMRDKLNAPVVTEMKNQTWASLKPLLERISPIRHSS